jgi:hypothetical protein
MEIQARDRDSHDFRAALAGLGSTPVAVLRDALKSRFLGSVAGGARGNPWLSKKFQPFLS